MRRLLEAVGALKSLVRTGWSQSSIPPSVGETVAAHSFEAVIIALALATEASARGVSISPERSAAVAAVHDLAEAVTGDLPPWSKGRCGSMDSEAASVLGVQRRLSELIEEFESEESPEALVARVADLLATAVQGARYASMGFRRAGEIGAACLKEALELARRHEWLARLISDDFGWLIEELREFGVPAGGWFD